MTGRREALATLLEHPELFLPYYFPHRIEKLEPFHLRLIEAATTRSRALILYPAEHGKTTLVSTLLPIWALCADPNTRIALIMKNDLDAKSVMQAIQSELLGNEELIEDFGPFRAEGDDTKPWALERMSIVKRTSRAKEVNLIAMGAGSRTILGYRSDWVIVDDCVTDVNSATPESRRKLREWFNLRVETSPEFVDSRLTVVGTLFDPEDLYNDLIELVTPDRGEQLYHVQREDAIQNEETHSTLWEERWPWERLMAKKAIMGTLDFNKRYRNISVDRSRMVFLEEYIKGEYVGKVKCPGCLDKRHSIGQYEDHWRRVAGFDPAIGRLSRGAKFCAHITLALGSCADHERCFWIVDLMRDQYSLPQQVDLVLSQHHAYSLDRSVVEANAYQMGLYQAISLKMEEQGLAHAIDPHFTTRMNKPDPETGVQSMARWFENGQVHIPWGNAESRRKMQLFIDELVQYPGRTTDTVMAFWFAWKSLQETVPRFRSYNRLVARGSIWSNPRMGRRVLPNPAFEQREVSV